MITRLFFTALVVLVCIVVSLFVGMSDIATLIGLVIIALLMSPVVLEFQMGSRIMLAQHLNRDGRLHERVGTPGLVTKFFATVAALVLSVGFFVSLKGVMMSHGPLSVLIIIALATLVLFPWLMPAGKRMAESGEIHENTGEYASFVASLVAVILGLNIVLAAVLSARDVGVFVTSDITVKNFGRIAAVSALEYTGLNTYSRTLINAYILTDHLKLAVGNMMFETFFPGVEKIRYFYLFYFGTFMMNLVKLMPLSVGFVVFIFGVRRNSDSLEVLVRKACIKFVPKVKKAFKTLRGDNGSSKARIDGESD